MLAKLPDFNYDIEVFLFILYFSLFLFLIAQILETNKINFTYRKVRIVLTHKDNDLEYLFLEWRKIWYLHGEIQCHRDKEDEDNL